MREISHSTTKPEFLPVLGFVFSIAFWFLDSIVDVLVFEEEATFIDSMFSPEPIEQWMRMMVILLMFLFSIYAKKMLIIQREIEDELRQHKEQLEMTVNDRTAELSNTNQQLKDEIENRKLSEIELVRLATTDPLTSLTNRRKFEECFIRENEREKRYSAGLSLIFCDVDRFKKINDTYGHEVGDRVLKKVAQVLQNGIRVNDTAARWGGEEFVLLVSNSTAESGRALAESLRQKIFEAEGMPIDTISASFGVTNVHEDDVLDTVIKRADEALYLAKDNGRNRVEVKWKE